VPLTVPFAAILAGGASRRFGGRPKALFQVGGGTILERVADAVRRASANPCLVTNTPEIFARFGMSMRADEIAGGGAASGIHTALRWASELGHSHALTVACDMPLLSHRLLRALLITAEEQDADAVLPESTGPLGVEPLCAVYSVRILASLEQMARAGGESMGSLLGRIDTTRIPIGTVRAYGDPALMFLNVNTPAELVVARSAVATRVSESGDEP
jgi:molybdenum cofactor guanylyltransferase